MAKKSDMVLYSAERKEPKVLKIKADESIMDSNTIEMPFMVEYKGPRITKINYILEQKTKGITVNLDVQGHNDYGVPTLKEFEVLMAIQRMFYKKYTVNNEIVLKQSDVTSDDLTIEFTFCQLSEEMGGTATPGTKTVESFKKSIAILKATTITSFCETENEDYLLKGESGVSFVNEYKWLELRSKDKKKSKTGVRIVVSKYFYETVLNGYMMYYDRETYLSIPNNTARKIYLLTLRWSGNNGYAVVTFNTLMQRIPMNVKQIKHKKQSLKEALAVLHESAASKVIYDENDRIFLVYDKDAKIKVQRFLNEYLDYESTEDQFIDYGFTREEIDKYLDIQRLKYIQALLRVVKCIKVYPKNAHIVPKEIIIDFIKNSRSIDKKYYPTEQQLKQQQQLSLF